jgi:hypothetical protein
MSDFLTMSDADFMAQGAGKLAEAQAAAETSTPDATTPDNVETSNADATAAAEALAAGTVTAPDTTATTETDEEGETQNEGGEQEEGGELGDGTDEANQAQPELGADGQPVTKPEVKKAEVSTSDTGLPEGAERIFATFRANGRDMQVKSVDEAIRLMQMGANYSQKQAVAKKDRAYVKVLEQNGLLDHEKLAFAVDLMAGKPEAIGKLLKDSKIDVHDIDDDKVAAYRAESRAPSAASLDLDEVVAEIEGTAHFTRLVGEMKTWDQKSQALLGSHPQALKQLTEQMESGVYDKIMDEVNRQQVLGAMTGVPVMQAYNEIGQKMAEAGAFNAPAPKGPVKKLVTPGKKTSPATKADEERRRAAAPSKGATTATQEAKKPDFLSMSDAEFLKQSKP